MATYQAIPDTDIDPESPGDATLFSRLRDNPIAVLQGDATAIAAGLRVNLDAVWTATNGGTKVLRPSGSNGVAWEDLWTGVSISTDSISLDSAGTYAVLAVGYRNDATRVVGFYLGMCYVHNGSIVSQYAHGDNGNAFTGQWSRDTNRFSITGTNPVIIGFPQYLTGYVSTLIAIRVR